MVGVLAGYKKLPACAKCGLLLVRGRDKQGNIINECPKCGRRWGSEIWDNEDGITWKLVKKTPYKVCTYVERSEESDKVKLTIIEEKRFGGGRIETTVIRVDKMPKKRIRRNREEEGHEIRRMQVA